MNKEILDFSSKLVKNIESQVLITPTQSVLRLLRKSLLPQRKLLQGQLIADAIALYHTEGLSVIGPCLGAQACITALEPILYKGAESITLIGYAGGLPSHELNIGDVISAKAHRNTLDPSVHSQENIQTAFHLQLAKTIQPKVSGNVISVESPYREDSEFAFEASRTAIAVDMETFWVNQLCKRYGAAFGSFLVISDIWDENWHPGFGKKHLESSMSQVLEAYVEAI